MPVIPCAICLSVGMRLKIMKKRIAQTLFNTTFIEINEKEKTDYIEECYIIMKSRIYDFYALEASDVIRLCLNKDELTRK